MEKRCEKCSWEWIPRVNYPRQCPNCRSYSWWVKPNSKCDTCDRVFQALTEHHIDGDRKNDSKENRMKLCRDCHTVIHNGVSSTNGNRARKYKENSDIFRKLMNYRNIWWSNKSKRLKNEN